MAGDPGRADAERLLHARVPGGLRAPADEIRELSTRKLGVLAQVARRKLEPFAHDELIGLGLDHILPPIDLTGLHAISFRDALIIQAAKAARGSTPHSEDLRPGSVFEGPRFVDPFAAED